MKKNLLITALLAVATSGNIQAQEESGYVYYDFGGTTWMDSDGYPNEGLFGVFNKVSANGQYAVGFDDQILFCSYMWNRNTPGQIEIVNNNPEKSTYLCDVANDGTVVGSYEPDTTSAMYPAYRTPEGEWFLLPVPENYSLKAAAGMTDDNARAITPDGKYIAGHLYIVTGMGVSEFDHVTPTEIRHLVPCLWEKKDTGYELVGNYYGRGAAGQSYIYNNGELELVNDSVADKYFFVYDISNDGSTIVGVNTSENGGQNPAFIRDGKMIQIFDCAREETNTFNGGVCSSIDAEGNIYGYFEDDELNFNYFVYTADGKLEYTVEWYICGDATGQRYCQSEDMLAYVLDCSEDGSVIVGAGVGTVFGGAINTPALLYNETKTGIDRIEAIRNNVDINHSGNVLTVTGEYSRADIYNAQGALIATGGQGKPFSLASQPAGAYIVKVQTANGVKTFKVAR